MPGPWDNYQARGSDTEALPWEKYSQPSGPGRGGRKPTQQQLDTQKENQHTRDLRYGIPTLATGIGELTSPGYRQKGIHDTLTGAGELAAPALLPAAAIAAPAATAGGLAESYIGSKLGHGAARMVGASDDAADLAGDVGGGLGALEGSTGFKAARYLAGGLKSLTPEWISKFNEAGKLKAGITKPPTKVAAEPATAKPAMSNSRYAKNDAPPAAPPPAPPTPPPGVSNSRYAKNDTVTPPPPPPKPAMSNSRYARNWTTEGSTAKPATPAPAAPTPGVPATVDAPKPNEADKSAAELMKAVGITPEEVGKATPEQWKMIEQQVGQAFDRQKAIEHLKTISEAKPAGKTSETPKTPRPSPGGEKVQSTVTPEARAARVEEHATKLAQRLKKDGIRELPGIADDAAWKLLEQQTGTEASPKVREAAITKARELWKADQQELDSRRKAHFESQGQ